MGVGALQLERKGNDVTQHTDTHAHGGGFISRYVFSFDHKIIGIQYIVTAILMALVGGLLALMMRMQLTWPGKPLPVIGSLLSHWMPDGVLLPESYIALVTMHGTIMVFFVISLALVSGFGNFIIPLQVGARDMAYPFLNMLSYWVMAVACVVMLASFFVKGGPAASGWTAYPPLSAVQAAVPGSGWGQTLWLLSMALFIASFTMGGLNYITTILSMRTKGMSMMRMPLTTWTMFVASALGVLAFPAVTAAAIMLLFDRHFGTSFFLPENLVIAGKLLPNQGGTPLLWQHLFWFLGHPEVYVLLLPALGVVFDIIPVFSRKPVFGYRVTVTALLVIGALSMVVWGHHMFVSGMNPFLGEFFSIGTLLVTLPSTAIGVNLLASLWGGNLQLKTPMLFAIGVVALFGLGGLGGIFLGNAVSDIYLHDSYFVVGHFHFMIGGVTLFGIYAGMYYWFPKMFGKFLGETLGKWHFWLSAVSFYAMFLTMHFVGLGGAPRRYYSMGEFSFLKQMQPLQTVVTFAAFVFVAAQFIFLFNLILSLMRGKRAGENPWRATTLEWTAPSPPPHGNWAGELPEVHRSPYEYSVLGEKEDFLPQNQK
jgi:cytochrome c oxidase subunit 1